MRTRHVIQDSYDRPPQAGTAIGDRSTLAAVLLAIAVCGGILSHAPSVTGFDESADRATDERLLAGRGEESDRCIWLGICD